MDDCFITKYSTIATAVKNTILRQGSTGARVEKESTIRPLRYITGESTKTRHGYYYMYSPKDLGTKDIDIADGGIYVETEDNQIKNSKYSMREIKTMLDNIATYEDKEITVAFIGQNYMNGSLMKKAKWTRYDDYLDTKVKEIYKKHNNLRLKVAFHELVNADNKNVFELNTTFIQFLVDNVADVSKEVKDLVAVFSKKETLAEIIVRGNVKTTDVDKEEIKKLYSDVINKFPMVKVFNKAFSRSDVDDNDHKVINDYFKNNA